MPTHWTYDAAAFNSTAAGSYAGTTIGQRNQIRLWIQDVNESRQLFQDEEIDWQITQEANAYTAAASLCDILVARAGGVKYKRIGDLALSYDPLLYRSISANLRARGMSYQVPYAGGISISDKQAAQNDSDWVPPTLPRGLGDNPEAPKPRIPPTNPLTTI